jgi:hypothetical protein
MEPPLRFLHSESSLSVAKLAQLRSVATADLVRSLEPGQPGALKTRPDGTVLEGHHRLFLLRERGFDVNVLPREILPPSDIDLG